MYLVSTLYVDRLRTGVCEVFKVVNDRACLSQEIF